MQVLTNSLLLFSQILSIVVLLICSYLVTMAWKGKKEAKAYVEDTINDLNDYEHRGIIAAFQSLLESRVVSAYESYPPDEINKYYRLKADLDAILYEINTLQIMVKRGKFTVTADTINGKPYIRFTSY